MFFSVTACWCGVMSGTPSAAFNSSARAHTCFLTLAASIYYLQMAVILRFIRTRTGAAVETAQAFIHESLAAHGAYDICPRKLRTARRLASQFAHRVPTLDARGLGPELHHHDQPTIAIRVLIAVRDYRRFRSGRRAAVAGRVAVAFARHVHVDHLPQ
jgi:hypothetical protein